MHSNRSTLLLSAGAALIALITIGGGWFVLYGGPDRRAPVEGELNAERAAEELSRQHARSDHLPPMEATTPGEVRQVVNFSRDATAGELPALREMALRSEDPLVAGNAIRALGRLGAVADDPQIVDLINDPRPRVRQEMVLVLGRSGQPAFEDRLIPLLDDGDSNLRQLVIHALGQLKGPRARLLLEEIVDSAASTRSERSFARTALAALDTPRRESIRPGRGD